jgi:hypothetical protein
MSDDRISQAREEFDQLAEHLATDGVVRASMFGKPCLKINGKAFACQFRDGTAFKLTPEPHAEALRLAGAELFDPSGKHRPMKEWVQVPVDHADRWPELAKAAGRTITG